jgi:crotonobetainyl-CoA:carnitine CoA-transferase CaiB-like acyl-CoA transferase
MGNRHPTIVPYETFTASDGDFVVAVGNDALWHSFCGALGLHSLAEDPRFGTNPSRVANYDALRPLVAAPLAGRTREESVRLLRAAGVPCGSVRDVAEVLGDPQLDARDMIATVEHAVAGAVRVLGVPIKLSDTPGAVRSAPPALGEHTDEILRRELGMPPDAIAALRAARAV